MSEVQFLYHSNQVHYTPFRCVSSVRPTTSGNASTAEKKLSGWMAWILVGVDSDANLVVSRWTNVHVCVVQTWTDRRDW